MKETIYARFLTKQESLMPFFVASINKTPFQPPVFRSKIEDAQFLFVLSGKGECLLNGEVKELNKNDLFYLSSGNQHNYKPLTKDFKTAYITFGGSGLSFFNPASGIYSLSGRYDFLEVFNKLYALKESGNFQELSVLLYKTLLELLPILDDNNTVKNKERISTALKIIKENPFATSKNLADSLNLSLEHFCRIFKNYTGFTPTNYINAVKLQKARNLLLYNDLTVSEVCYLAGFNDISYFGKLFKKAYGVSPSEYKK